MAIVVTGATGGLGGLVVRRLVELGVDPRHVVAAGRHPQRLAAVAVGGVRGTPIDYDAPESLDAVLGRGDTVLFVSGNVPGERLTQHAAVGETARRARVRRLVYTSITRASTVDTVLTPDHRATEELIQASGVPFTILRNNLYAETQVPKVIEAATRNQIVAGWSDGRVAGASRADYAEGAAAVLVAGGHENAVYEFAADTSWGLGDVARAASTVLGRHISFGLRTGDETEIQLALDGVPVERRQLAIALDANIRDGAFDAPSSVLSGLLGRPTTPLVDALRAALPRDLPTPPPTTATPVHGGVA